MTVCFSGQVIMGSLAQPGDSGSLIVDADTAQPMGLLARRVPMVDLRLPIL
jgi:hypothetical protein